MRISRSTLDLASELFVSLEESGLTKSSFKISEKQRGIELHFPSFEAL